jgi:hypothetical protein
MAGHTNQKQVDRAPHYSAKKVRGAEIILRTRAERLIFIAGLIGAVILALLFGWR